MRLRGLLISPGKGLIFFSPLVIVGLLGWPLFLRRHRLLAASAALAVAAAALGHARMHEWAGDQAWGPRYMVPVAALFIIPVACLLEQYLGDRRRYRTPLLGVCLVAIWAFAVQLPGMGIDYFAVMVRHPDIVANYFSFQHSQLGYQTRAFLTGVTGHAPYAAGGIIQTPVPALDWWWVRAVTTGQNPIAAVAGAIGLCVIAGMAGAHVGRSLRQPNPRAWHPGAVRNAANP